MSQLTKDQVINEESEENLSGTKSKKQMGWKPPFLVKEWFNDIHDAEKTLCKDFEPDFKWWMLKVLAEDKPPDYDAILEAIRSSPTLAAGESAKEEEVPVGEGKEETTPVDHGSRADSASPTIHELPQVSGEVLEERSRVPRLLLKKPNLEELFQLQDILSVNDDLLVIPPTQPPTPPADILEDRRSVFQKMISMTNNQVAANWRKPVQKTSYTEMTLEEQSEFESAQIAKDFCKWLESIGMENLRIDEKTLKELFDINLDFPATLSFCVEIKELPSVPKSIAELYEVRHKAERAITRQLLKWDSGYEREEIKSIAFGKSLPVPEKHKPWNKDTFNLWFWPKFVTRELKSGRALWEQLLGSEVLDYYCIWLIENPQQPVPEFLSQIGYIDKVKEKYEENKDKYDIIKKKRDAENEFWLFSKSQYEQNEEKYIENIPAIQEVQFLMKEKKIKSYCEDCEEDLKLIMAKKEMALLEEQQMQMEEKLLKEGETINDEDNKNEEEETKLPEKVEQIEEDNAQEIKDNDQIATTTTDNNEANNQIATTTDDNNLTTNDNENLEHQDPIISENVENVE